VSAVGASVPRKEDRRLLTGTGQFVDDVDRPGQLWVRFVRSPSAHARLVGVDTAEAEAVPGVAGVLTAADFGDDAPRIPIRLAVDVPTTVDRDLDAFLQPVLATDRVRYVGEPVAVVVAEDPYVAEDAAELVVVSLDDLPSVLDARRAVGDSPRLWDGGNEAACLRVAFGDAGAAFAAAARVVRAEVKVGRHGGVPLETRGLVADPENDRLEIWGSTKVPNFNREVLARLLGVSADAVRMHPVDAGGGFGARGEFYPEDFVVPYLALRLGRPVKWIEDRAENLVATNHSREQLHRIEAGFDGDGRLLGLRDEIWHDNGAYLRTHGVAVPELTATMLAGPYRVPALDVVVHVALTNKTPCGTYRAPGRYEGTFAREHLLDVAADELGIDRVELRRRNLLRRHELPHERPVTTLNTPMVLDAGDYHELLDAALTHFGFADWVAEAEWARAEGRLVGTGVGYFLEKSGLGPFDTADVEVDESGSVRVVSGGTSFGQGLETVMAQIAASELGVDVSRVAVVHTRSDLTPDGTGSWASRSTVVGGSAVFLAARAVADKARRVAARLLEAADTDVVLAGGRAHVVGAPAVGVTLGEVAMASRPGGAGWEAGDERDGLGARRVFSVEHMTYPYGVHLAQVDVDPGSGAVRVLRYAIAYEVGRAVNPPLVQGQLRGGAAQGIGGALYEEFRYDEAGQPTSASFVDYLIPTAAEVPPVETLVLEAWPAPGNPLGVRGAGEGGITGCGAAIANAVRDALRVRGALPGLPLTPPVVAEFLPGGSGVHDPLALGAVDRDVGAVDEAGAG
jgi:carbon-monoxide dehydrogenase large subunit/6-hydroxypseudooxynicotine dehydrogenase subunit gamma